MNVHTKWNCLMPILSILVKHHLFQSATGGGANQCRGYGHGSQHMYACAEFIPDLPASEKANFRVIVTLRPYDSFVKLLPEMRCYLDDVSRVRYAISASVLEANVCRSVTSLRFHTTSSGKLLLKVSRFFRVLTYTTKKRNVIRQ